MRWVPTRRWTGVAGYTLMNDLSARDLQLATTQWMAGKTFDGAAPCGPALVTADEVDHGAIEFELSLNGEEMQASATSDLIFSVPELVAHLSTLMTLEPGDLISTGTPSGVGIARQPSVWLQAGGRGRDQLAAAGPASDSRGLKPLRRAPSLLHHLRQVMVPLSSTLPDDVTKE